MASTVKGAIMIAAPGGFAQARRPAAARPAISGRRTALPKKPAPTLAGRRQWRALLAQPRLAPVQAATVEAPAGEVLESWEHSVGEGSISAEAVQVGEEVLLSIQSSMTGDWKMHWAVNGWELPPAEVWPPGTNKMDDKAVQTPLAGGVQMRFNVEGAPQRIVFVLTDGQNWINMGASDFSVNIAPPSLKSSVDAIIADEQSSCLFKRYQMALGMTGEMSIVGDEGVALLYTWLRYSANKQLRWYHKEAYNYQGKDMASTQKCLAEAFQRMAQNGKTGMSRMLARMTLAGLPRGGGNGDDIRMTILNIMRENGIKEGHRPGIEDTFIKQWHQKLHSNTTPEDICICEAYIHFLHTGNWDDFWAHLWDNHKMTREDLAQMRSGWRNDDGITGPACHLPQLIGPMKHMLWILKVTHSGADLDSAFSMAHGYLGDDEAWAIGDLLKNRDEWWVPGKIVEIRESLQWNWKAEGSGRDVMLLDIALENYFRTVVERTDCSQMSRDDLVSQVEMVLRNGVICAEDDGISKALALWQKMMGEGDRWSPRWSLQAKAALEVAGGALGTMMDRLVSLIEPHAHAIGKGCDIDSSYVTNFAEEVVRGHPLGILSSLLTELEMHVADAAGLGKWQIVSAASPPVAKVLVTNLADIQGQTFDVPTVVISDQLGGLEDVPQGVVAVISASITDILSHIAIRARGQGVLLASCRDSAALDAMRGMAGGFAEVRLSQDGGVSMTTAAEPAGGASTNGGGGAPRVHLSQPPMPPPSWVIPESDFVGSASVGGKSKGLAALKAALPPGIKVPSSVALPYGAFDKALNADGAAKAKYEEALQTLSTAASAPGLPAKELAAIRQAIGNIAAPSGLAAELSGAAAKAGLPGAGEWAGEAGGWKDVWAAVKEVWASKWSDRAWLSRRANGIPDSDLHMAVLLQEVLPSEYAFVLHTANPITGARGEVVGEVVRGLGEVLVGNAPGSALTFSAPAGGAPTMLSYPSKVLSLSSPGAGTIIARSDSNGEDLEGFAGAGLYDSVMSSPAVEAAVDYTSEPLFWDAGAAEAMMAQLADAARAMEAAMGGAPQDIEGALIGGELYVVQSRPQVL